MVAPGPRRTYEVGALRGLPGKWQAAILEAEQNRPTLRVVASD